MGGAGDSPAPVGDLPTGMAKRHLAKMALPLLRPAIFLPSGGSPVPAENEFSDTRSIRCDEMARMMIR